MDLDEVDWKIIRQLQLDGRQSFRSLGHSVGFTGLGARKRFQRLKEQRIIDVSARVNASALGIQLAMVMLEVEDGAAIQGILELFHDCPRVLNFYTTLGGYNLVALVMAEDEKIMECEAMEECSLRSARGIRRSEFFPVTDVHYSPFVHLRVLPSSVRDYMAPCRANCLSCKSFQSEKCLGCPATSHYRGPLR